MHRRVIERSFIFPGTTFCCKFPLNIAFTFHCFGYIVAFHMSSISSCQDPLWPYSFYFILYAFSSSPLYFLSRGRNLLISALLRNRFFDFGLYQYLSM